MESPCQLRRPLQATAFAALALLAMPVAPAATDDARPAEKPPGKRDAPGRAATASPARIRISRDGRDFEIGDPPVRFVAWGFNYDHDADGRLLEDYWDEEWPTVEEDFREMKALGANVVRIHLQFGRFMRTPTDANPPALRQLARLLDLAEECGLHLDLTGLGCYHKADVPAWYDRLPEADRWDAQAAFWSAIARTCADSPAVFCYDLMNEPILPGEGTPESEWLAGEFGGKHFVQRIALDLGGRSRADVAKAWLEKLTAAIRAHDPERLVTVGVIPWPMVFPGAKPIFHAPGVGDTLDFVSIHVYPESKLPERAIDTVAAYDVGKPILVEEIFPLKCSTSELRAFITASRPHCDGWIGFYWGREISEYGDPPATIGDAITRDWLTLFRALAPEFAAPPAETRSP